MATSCYLSMKAPANLLRYGHLTFRDGDYILLPRSTMWRIEPSSPVTAC